jgi:cobalt-precorrin 5A hydrolase
MKLAIISFTDRGTRLAIELGRILPASGYDCTCYASDKYADQYGLLRLERSLSQWAGDMFQTQEALLFVSASGIAVRAIAPWVKDKMKDPAVVVMDERGTFAISLLSGHMGGANELAGLLANVTGAIPVITTATDVNGRFAVDVFAKKQKMRIGERNIAKEISARVLEEEPIGLFTEFPVESRIPEELVQVGDHDAFSGKAGIVIALNGERSPFKYNLHLYPTIVTLGIGCRKGMDSERLEEAVLDLLQTNHLSVKCLEQVATIDLKKEEQAILDFCRKYQIPLRTFSQEELSKVEGDFTASDFVKQVTGVDNVCERSAVLGSGGKLIQKKKAAGGITLAIAVRDWSVDFE